MRLVLLALLLGCLFAQGATAADTWPMDNFAAGDTAYAIEDAIPRSFDLNNLPYGELTVLKADGQTKVLLGDVRFVEIIADGQVEVSFYQNGGDWTANIKWSTGSYCTLSYWSDY